MDQNQPQVKDLPDIRILMLGDKGVGKTSVTNLMATSADTPTVASRSVDQGYFNIQLLLHEYSLEYPNVQLPPTPIWTSPSSSDHSDKYLFPQHTPAKSGILYFVEFINTNSQRRMDRKQRKNIFKYIDGIVLVYNLQDLRSQDNLHEWLDEPLHQICKHRQRRPHSILKIHHVPILVVGTRLDQLNRRPLRRSAIADQLKAEEILLNSQDTESFANKSRNQGKLGAFLNRVVEFKERYPTALSRDFIYWENQK